MSEWVGECVCVCLCVFVPVCVYLCLRVIVYACLFLFLCVCVCSHQSVALAIRSVCPCKQVVESVEPDIMPVTKYLRLAAQHALPVGPYSHRPLDLKIVKGCQTHGEVGHV